MAVYPRFAIRQFNDTNMNTAQPNWVSEIRYGDRETGSNIISAFKIDVNGILTAEPIILIFPWYSLTSEPPFEFLRHASYKLRLRFTLLRFNSRLMLMAARFYFSLLIMSYGI